MADAPQLAYDPTPALAHVEPKRDVMRDGVYPQRYWDDPPSGAPPISPTPAPQDKTILGLQKRNFWILFGVLFVVVIATIGGSVGGSLAVRNSKYVV
jgi:hypothetical protein